MIKILEKGQKTFVKTCDRCGCKFQYDLSDLSGADYISCPCCHTTLVHVGPKAVKIDLNKSTSTDLDKYLEDMRKNTVITPYKIEVGDGRYNYATTTGTDTNMTVTVKANEVSKPSTLTGGDPNATIYANKLPDDIVNDPYNNIGGDLPDDIFPGNVSDDC